MGNKIFRIYCNLSEGYPKSRKKEKGVLIVKLNRKWPIIDCLWLHDDMGFAVSERAKKFLKNLKIPGLQFKAVRVNIGKFYRCYTTRIIDCLDRKKSIIDYFDRRKKEIMEIEDHVLKHDKIRAQDIFAIPEHYNPENPQHQDTWVTESVKNEIQAAGLVGFQFNQIEEDRDPLAISSTPYVLEEDQFGIRLEVPDGWSISTEKLRGVTPDKLEPRKISKNGSCSPHERLLLDMSFMRLDVPIKRDGGIDLWLCKNTTELSMQELLRRNLKEYKEDCDKSKRGTMKIANTKFDYIDDYLEGRTQQGVIRYALAALDKQYYISIMLRGYTPPLFEAIQKIISKLEFRKTM